MQKKVKIKESVIQRQVLDYLELKNIFCWRSNNIAVQGRSFNGMYGVADILGLTSEGQFFGLEIKSEKGVLSDHQKYFKFKVEQNKGIYLVIKSLDDIIKNLDLIR